MLASGRSRFVFLLSRMSVLDGSDVACSAVGFAGRRGGDRPLRGAGQGRLEGADDGRGRCRGPCLALLDRTGGAGAFGRSSGRPGKLPAILSLSCPGLRSTASAGGCFAAGWEPCLFRLADVASIASQTSGLIACFFDRHAGLARRASRRRTAPLPGPRSALVLPQRSRARASSDCRISQRCWCAVAMSAGALPIQVELLC